MKFLIDECISYSIIAWLRNNGYDVKLMKVISPGLSDDVILEIAHSENRILLTCDKDFGEIAYARKKIHSGIILLRLNSFSATKNIQVLKEILENHKNEISGSFIVATASNIRIGRLN